MFDYLVYQRDCEFAIAGFSNYENAKDFVNELQRKNRSMLVSPWTEYTITKVVELEVKEVSKNEKSIG